MHNLVSNLTVSLVVFFSLFGPLYDLQKNHLSMATYNKPLENLDHSSVYQIKNSISYSNATFNEVYFDLEGNLIYMNDGTLQPNQTIVKDLSTYEMLPSDWYGYVMVVSDQPLEISRENDLFYDGFYDQLLDDVTWSYSTTDHGSYEFDDTDINNPFLNLLSGTTNTGISTLTSMDGFLMDSQMLRIDTRLKTNGNAGYFWGLQGNEGDGTAAFELSTSGELQAIVRRNLSASETIFRIPGIDITGWHHYRIEITPSYANFYVDGELKTSFLENLPLTKNLNFQVLNTSFGNSKTLSLDFVEVSVYSNIYTISGTVLTNKGLPGIHIPMRLTPSGNIVHTGEQGLFQFVNLFPGNYEIDTSDDTLVLAPGRHTVSITNQPVEDVNFVITNPPIPKRYIIYLPAILR